MSIMKSKNARGSKALNGRAVQATNPVAKARLQQAADQLKEKMLAPYITAADAAAKAVVIRRWGF